MRQVTVDLVRQVVSGPDGAEHAFAIDAESREMLLEGLDAIDLTLKQRGAIDAFTAADRERSAMDLSAAMKPPEPVHDE